MIRETQSTNSNGAVSFAALPLGCSYSLSIESQDLCWYSASSQLVAAGGTATFAIDASLLDSSALVIPPDTTVSCLADTSPATTGYATLCGASLTFADTVTKKECTGPGGLLAIIKRAWSYESHIRTQTINVVDSKTIIFTSVPASTTVPAIRAPRPRRPTPPRAQPSPSRLQTRASARATPPPAPLDAISFVRLRPPTCVATQHRGLRPSRRRAEAHGSRNRRHHPFARVRHHRRQTAASSVMMKTWHK